MATGSARPGLDPARWSSLVSRIAPGLGADATFRVLRDAYGERHRAYHTAAHIADCLERFDEARDLCATPDEVEYALWLHDVVYATRSADSEARSADLADEWLAQGGASPEVRARVRAMILATVHGGDPPRGDAALMLDIDLSILGADEARFDAYEDNVRREFRWVPGPLFRSKRAELLEAFLARPRLFVTDDFHGRFEDAARANLRRSIDRLRRA